MTFTAAWLRTLLLSLSSPLLPNSTTALLMKFETDRWYQWHNTHWTEAFNTFCVTFHSVVISWLNELKLVQWLQRMYFGMVFWSCFSCIFLSELKNYPSCGAVWSEICIVTDNTLDGRLGFIIIQCCQSVGLSQYSNSADLPIKSHPLWNQAHFD